MPYLSVIIPLFNKEEQIRTTINSVLTQDFNDFELIIVNDGSTDNSLQVVGEIHDERIRIISQFNAGVSEARNRGMEEARGEYIFLLDADDVLLPGAFNVLLDKRKEDIIIGGFNQITPGGRITRVSHNKIYGKVDDSYKAYCHKEIFLRIGNMFIRKIFLENKDGFRKDLSLYEDEEWILRILDGASVYSNQQVVLNYRREIGGLSFGFKPVEKDWACIASVKNVNNKYRKRILGDFIFRRFVLRMRRKDWHGLKVIWHNNSWRLLYCASAFIGRSLRGDFIKNYIRDEF